MYPLPVSGEEGETEGRHNREEGENERKERVERRGKGRDEMVKGRGGEGSGVQVLKKGGKEPVGDERN